MTPLINRELSWIAFNERVLAETSKLENLILDRLKFLAISASNLDEFFMVRVAYLNDHRSDRTGGEASIAAAGQLEKLLTRIRNFQFEQSSRLAEILCDLRTKGVIFLKINELDEFQLRFIRKYFEDEVLPVITPLAIDPSRPFPVLANHSLNIGIRLKDSEKKSLYSVIQVPSILTRFVPLPHPQEQSVEGRYFLPLEDLISYYLPEICNLHEIKAYGYFRITRSADFDADEDTDNLLEEMKRTIKKRKRGKPVHLELSEGFDEKMKEFLRNMLPISRRFIFELPGFLGLSSLMKISALKGFEHLRVPGINPVIAEDFEGWDDIFAAIRERDRMIHHPYESFDHVVDFINSAASDPDVLAIKQTLYRVSGKSGIVAALEHAAEAGKQVTVLVELKARFDEENNIQWAAKLERAGCHVIYGLAWLKTHCKITLVVRREPDGIRRYLHLSTGNYNDATAKIYTDIGMFTCRPEFGSDASSLFNHLTGFSVPPQYNKLIVAPESMKTFFLNKIQNEIENAKSGIKSGINIKVNSLLDSDIVKKLYDASQAGVKIQLLVRGICSLLPGASGTSENIRVLSIIGRFLEHSRIFIFENGGNPEMYLGSADLMPRNLERRVELVFPVMDNLLKKRIADLLDLMWRDNTCAWELSEDYEYRRVKRAEGEKSVNSQLELLR